MTTYRYTLTIEAPEDPPTAELLARIEQFVNAAMQRAYVDGRATLTPVGDCWGEYCACPHERPVVSVSEAVRA